MNEIVILEETKELYNYSLSNNLEDIKIAIYARTGYDINLNDAKWELNSKLSISVKHIMNKYQVNFSMTTDTNTASKSKQIIINMRNNDLWFITGYEEIDSALYSWDKINTCKTAIYLIKRYLSIDDE